MEKIICQNKKASYNFFLTDKIRAGISLVGTEIKSLRNNGATFHDAYCSIDDNELYLNGLHIGKYEHGNIFNHDPDRKKKLLVTKREILKMAQQIKKSGKTIVPIKIVIVDGLAKVDIALAEGKKLYDKREDLKNKDQQRYIDKHLR